MAEDPA
jgi:chromosome segregation ATPase